MAHALEAFYCRGALGTRVNPDIIGCVWTGEFDLNTLRVDGEIFESGKKKLRIQKYPDTCGRGLRLRRIWSFYILVLKRTAKKCAKIYNARAQLLFCSLNLLFGDVLVVVVGVALRTTPSKHGYIFFLRISHLSRSVQCACWSQNLLKLDM